MRQEVKLKVLAIMQLPPPVHGASLMNEYIKNSVSINSTFDIDYLDLTTSQKIEEIGRVGLKKIRRTVAVYYAVISHLIQNEYDFGYVTLSPNGPALYKDAIIIFLCKAKRLRTVIHLHGKGIKEAASQSFFKRWFYKTLFARTYVICLSEMMTKDIAGIVVKREPIVLNNGIPDKNPAGAVRYNAESRVLKLLYLSNFVRTKGILVLLEALKLLSAKHDGFICSLIGGEGDLSYSFVQNQINKQNLVHKVIVVGARYGSAKDEELSKADILIFPSFYEAEAFPLVLLEAMMHGLPVISTSEGGIPDIVDDGITGVLIPKGDAAALAESLLCLMNDRRLLQRMSVAGRKKYENRYTSDVFDREFIRLFHDLSK